jgi:hypothetical protein
MMPDFVPWIDTDTMLKGHRQWIAQGKEPITDPVVFWDKVMSMDMDTMAHMYFIDDWVRWLKHQGKL